MWIVVNALLLYNIAVRSGRFDAFRDWIITHLRRTTGASYWWWLSAFCFEVLPEGVAGFGTSVAIASACCSS